MIQFLAAAALGVGVYAASRMIARELRRVGDPGDEERKTLNKDQRSKTPEPLPVRLEKDQSTGRYRPVEKPAGFQERQVGPEPGDD